ncbi:hypothetical protein EVAR_18358_1 [Eumeta japonica]|uniref:Uncharacterized protein n=1 Tax=Eumeta variegata TaxID=151549 RepID=A0A4C1UUA3_EUMVA|nr:hypothetical protein EVAR_18358_1 [Eumeta japonica]
MGRTRTNLGTLSRHARRAKNKRKLKYVIQKAIITDEGSICKKFQEDSKFANEFKKIAEEQELIEKVRHLENSIFHMEFEKLRCAQLD